MDNEKLNKTEARQGIELKTMRYVLTASLSLAVAALAIVLFAFI